MQNNKTETKIEHSQTMGSTFNTRITALERTAA